MNPATTHTGKLTSLYPNFENISLSKTPSVFSVPCDPQSSLTSQYEWQIHQDQEDYFVSYTGSGLSVYIEDQLLKESEPFKINSGEKIALIINETMKVEYIFSSELVETEKNLLKRDREEADEEVIMIEKQRKVFYADLENETKCGICKKMILECASALPCLHKLCIECLLLHLASSQTCPLCGVKCVEFRKDTFFNNIIEAYEEDGYRNDRSKEECREIRERLERERIFLRFEYPNESRYEGEWKKFRKDGKGKMIYNNGIVYEGDWKNDVIEGTGKVTYKLGSFYEGGMKNGLFYGKGKMVYTNGNAYEGDWKNNQLEGQGKMIFKNGDVYEGEWKNSLHDGQGKMMYNNGYIYEGQWKSGELDGKGKMIYNDNGTGTGGKKVSPEAEFL